MQPLPPDLPERFALRLRITVNGLAQPFEVPILPRMPILPTWGLSTPSNAIWHGQGAPAGNLGSVGDFYLDTQNNLLYGPKLDATDWNGPDGQTLMAGVSLVGPAGPQGLAGADGAKGDQGPQGPAGGSYPILPNPGGPGQGASI